MYGQRVNSIIRAQVLEDPNSPYVSRARAKLGSPMSYDSPLLVYVHAVLSYRHFILHYCGRRGLSNLSPTGLEEL